MMTARLCYDSLKVDLLCGFMCCLHDKTDRDWTHWTLCHMLQWTHAVQSLWEHRLILPLWLFSTIATCTTQLFQGGTHSNWAKQIKLVCTHAENHTESSVFWKHRVRYYPNLILKKWLSSADHSLSITLTQTASSLPTGRAFTTTGQTGTFQIKIIIVFS